MSRKSRIGLVFGVFMSLIASFFVSAPAAALESDTVNLTVHYQRPAGDYENWNVYLWRNDDAAGKDQEVDPN